jgi:hypothetical protein
MANAFVVTMARVLNHPEGVEHVNLCWSADLNELIREVLEAGQLGTAANMLEVLGTTDRNIHKSASWVERYMQATCIHLASVCYAGAGACEYGMALARANLTRYEHDLRRLVKPARPELVALETELRADITVPFDPEASSRLYDEALTRFAGLEPLAEDGEICEHYWGLLLQLMEWVYPACAGREHDHCLNEKADKRIPRKRALLSAILQEAHTAR